MCNLTKKTERQTVTVYKSVEKYNGNYYSYFAATQIKLGKVEPQTMTNRCHEVGGCLFYDKTDEKYNEHMVGKCSGFKTKSDALKLIGDRRNDHILKVVLGGEIWRGDAKNISAGIEASAVIFAGSEIISFKEV